MRKNKGKESGKGYLEKRAENEEVWMEGMIKRKRKERRKRRKMIKKKK